MQNSRNKIIFVDFHVHIHSCFNLNEFLNYAFKNFLNAASSTNSNFELGFLFLTEIGDVDFFDRIKKSSQLLDNFNIEFTKEEYSLIISNNGQKIFLIAGKQVISHENIEVLALATRERFKSGNSLKEIVNEVNNKNGIPVLPWGVGKWLGRRKEIIEDLIVKTSGTNFYLGDNGGRPTFWSEPKLFNLAERKGIFTLCGTDSLSLESEVRKPGRYGNLLKGTIDFDYPVKTLMDILNHMNSSPQSFGKLENPVTFFKNQIALRLKQSKKQ
ncbi:hypothetical protein BMS3Abin04_01112 [bacterium BMS3Abin04]|nr:hypothetical protein BMS3Abin04_01112 [bacterium BMS3Abin04]